MFHRSRPVRRGTDRGDPRSKNPAEKGVSPDESESTSTEDSSEVVPGLSR